MHVVDEPAAAAGPDQVDRQHLTAIGALQLDAVAPQIIATGDQQRSFNDTVPRMVEILLDHGEALPQHVRVHGAGRGSTLGAPQLPHAPLVVGFDGGEELREGFIHRLRERRAGAGITATGRNTGNQEQEQREPSHHESVPGVEKKPR